MKFYYFLSALFCCFGTWLSAQTSIDLSIQHKFEKLDLVLGQTYWTKDNKAILINQIQYYISDLELVYDGEQSTMISSQNESCFLIDATMNTYPLGTINATIRELEAFNFKVGLDSSSNLSQPSDYTLGQSLANSEMYSTAQQSYIFVRIKGMIDTNDDQIPNQLFDFRATGNQLLRDINIKTTNPSISNKLKISLICNVSNWLNEIDLATIGLQENGGIFNEQLCDNASKYSVFSTVSTTNINNIASPQNHIYIDSRFHGTATIYYKFYTNELINMTITNVAGTYFMQHFSLAPEGDYFIDNNLVSGVYIVIFTTEKGIRQSKKFVIRN